MKFKANVIFSDGDNYNIDIVGAVDKEEAELKLIAHIIQQRIWTNQILKQIIIEEQ